MHFGKCIKYKVASGHNIFNKTHILFNPLIPLTKQETLNLMHELFQRSLDAFI